MGKYQLTNAAADALAEINPDDQSKVVRTLDILLDNPRLRHISKFDLCLPLENGKKTWGIRMGRVWIGFIEEDDNDMSIIHLSMLSRFRYDD